MPDTFTSTTTQSWGGRLIQSIKSVLVGFVFFVASIPLLWWNESRAVQTERSLDEGAGVIISTPADSLDPSKEGKLVHMSGMMTTQQPVADDALPVQADAIKLARKVEMYQWTEEKETKTESKVGGGETTTTTYSYNKEWVEGHVDSSQFQHPENHENPPAPQFASQTFVADPVKIGAHKLTPEQLAKLETSVEYPVADDAAEQLPAELAEQMQVSKGKFYMGADEATPELGDVRISYSVVKPAPVSLAAMQSGDSFAPYQAKEGDQLLLVQEGIHTAAAMFAKAQSDNAALTWVLRGVGFLIMFLGMLLVFKPLVVFADVIPLFGTLLGAGIGTFSFLGSAALSAFVIAAAWIFVRPLLGISLAVITLGALFWLLKVGRKKKAERAANASMAPAAAS
ncbi:MAG TPA: TMEM43 family protein [Thermoanaerobaculia bacterium]|nr:TMEM43 family protein [Thermoanaerobaculia bacterium]